MHHPTDTVLAQRLRERDLAAYDALYCKYHKLLCVSAYFFLKNEQEAKDLVQTLFLDIWEKQLYLHFHNDVKGYLFLAIKNRCLNYQKKMQTQLKLQQGYAGSQEAINPVNAEATPDYQELYAALDDIPARKRVAIQMVYFHGQAYREAASTMGISVNSLKTHLKTGLKVLRAEIKKI